MMTITSDHPSAPFSVTKGTESFTIREARRDELDAIGWAAAEAFINDAVVHYIAGAKKPMSATNEKDLRGVYDFYYFLFKACMISEGRAIIAVPDASESTSSNTKTTISAAACWYPPKHRIKAFIALRGGLIKCIRNWGFPSLDRMAGDFEDTTHEVCKRAFEAKAMEFPASASKRARKVLEWDDAWYLAVAFSSKKYEGRGFLSTLMREGYAHMQRTTPGIPVTLESSSSRSRDRYIHLGFELMEPQTILGVGKVTPLGIAPLDKEQARKQKDELTGMPYYNMVNWDPSKSLGNR
ncbi:hypothetical protein BT96DRAFT_137378 [Gymnopus androsaceus JB14]|uniref:N-acetyltransferase domain-containing protein n=1 Tax=Gymnopus androsaceus JB14 TaxID=1447944 RepID=A0A6A4HCY4_9AGAR|nr:hypothetical protein BT96DRAFT_137378 [Gymnopus androsaceus JB14]